MYVFIVVVLFKYIYIDCENLSYTDCSVLCPVVSRFLGYHGSIDATYLIENVANITYNFIMNQKIGKHADFIPLT